MKTIRLRIVIPVILCVFSGTVALLLTLNRLHEARLSGIANAEDALRATMPALQESISVDLMNHILPRVRQKISLAALDPNVRSLLLADEAHKVIFANRYEWQDAPATSVSSYAPAIAAESAQTMVCKVIPDEKSMHLDGYYPVSLGAEKGEIRPSRRGVLFVEYDYSRSLAQARSDALRDAFHLCLAFFVLAGALAVFLHFLVTQPVERLSKTVGELTGGNLSARVGMTGRDEISHLAEAFDRMADQLAADVDARKHAAEALELAKVSAEGTNRAKDQFLAVLSHELRTPLTPVLATVSGLQADPSLPAELRADIDMIRRNVDTEVKLIDDLLDLTMINRRKLQLSFEIVDIHSCLQSVLEICQAEITSKRIGFVKDLGAEDTNVWADPARLRQVFWNLLKNAVKFTPEGGQITIRSRSGNGRLKIDFIDTGVGILPEVLPRIFEVFEQGEQEKIRRFGGLGLGLSIAKAVVEMHQGSIRAYSDGKNRGATFTVELGTVVPSCEPVRSENPASASPYALKILLVDDHNDTLRILSRMLCKWGHSVTTAACVQCALDAAAKERFDLLISDLGLPDGSGLDLMRQLKPLYGVPGIALSGYGTNDDIQQSEAAGFETHLVKPVSAGALRRTLDAIGARSAA